MARSFSAELADTSPIVFHTDEGSVTDPANRAAIDASAAAPCRSTPPSPPSTDPFAEGSTTVSADGKTAYANIVPAEPLGDLSVEEAEAILDTATEPTEGTAVDVAAGGQLGTKVSKPETTDQRARRHPRRHAHPDAGVRHRHRDGAPDRELRSSAC